MRKQWLFLLVLFCLAFVGCVKRVDVPEQKEKEAYVFADGARFKHPPTWTVKANPGYLTIAGPDPGFYVYIFKAPRLSQASTDARAFWQQIHPKFSYPVFMAQTLPGERGFEGIDTVVFDVPSQESKSIIAIALSAKESTYWLLIEATNELMSRRHAELMLILQSFLAPNYGGDVLVQKTPKVWGKPETKAFHDFIVTALHELKVPGASVLVIDKNGNRIFQDALGVKEITKKTPVTIDTPFLIGSTTKALTTLMMAQLVDRGIISWQTKLKDVLADFAVNDAELTNAITMHNSVSASTGMPRRDFEFIFEYKGVSAADRIKELHFMAPTTKIGETFQYSNHLVMAGGYAASIAYRRHLSLEQSYVQAMNDLVFKPLAMKHTVLSFADAKRLGNAFPHAKDMNQNLKQIPLEQEGAVSSMAPAGGLWSTAPDLGRYIVLELNNGEIDGRRIIGQAPLLARRKPGAYMGESYYYGLGLFIEDILGLTLVGHDGNTLGFSSLLFFLPEQGLGMVVLTNASAANSFLRAVKQKFLEITFNAPNKSNAILDVALSLEKSWSDELQKHILQDGKDTAWIKAWKGIYKNATLGTIAIKQRRNGTFYLDSGEWQSDLASYIESNDKKTIFLTTPPYNFIFQPDDEKKILLLDEGQQKYEFHPVKKGK